MKTISNNSLGNDDVAILVVSCDAYQDLWHPFFACFYKYWADCPFPVYLGSNHAKYPDKRVRSVLIGGDIDYSSNLIRMIDQIPQEWLILWVEDRVLTKTVDTHRIAEFVSFSHQRKAGYVKLIATHPFSLLGEEGPGVGEIPKGAKYRIGITVGLWRKRVLRELLLPGESAWQLERLGSRRSDALIDTFYALHYGGKSMPPLPDKHLVIKGRIVRDAIRFLKRERLDNYLTNRPIQSIGSFLYVKIYVAALDSLAWIQWWWKCVTKSFPGDARP